VQQTSTTVHSHDQVSDRCVTATDDGHALIRGLVHGLILSMAMWTAALYVTLALR
jgi:hypothetical protein